MAAIIRRTIDADDSSGPKVELQPEKLLDEVPAGVDYRELMSDAAFMSEPVVIYLQPLGQEENEPAVSVGVNGDRAFIVPGKLTRVKRYHVAQLIKARPDYVTHSGGDVAAPEQSHNRLFSQSTSRYNFDVVEDTAKGREWFIKFRQQYTKRR